MPRKLTWLAIIIFVFASKYTYADISGFDGLSGWTYNQGDGGNAASVGPNSIEITNGGNQRRSIWFNLDQDIQDFTASFHYQVSGGGFSSNEGGIAFIVQNDVDALFGLTDSTFGYGFQGIDNSVGITLELNGITGSTSTGFYRNGVVGSGSTSVSPHNAGGGFDVIATYDGSRLALEIDDGINTPFSRTIIVSPSVESSVGSTRALVGFGAATTRNGVVQTISDFSYTTSAVPEPSAVLSLIGLAGACCLRRKRSRC